jgi:hypothetical protein
VVLVGLSGCAGMVNPNDAQTYTADTLVVLDRASITARSAGQSFVSHRSGLESLTVWLEAGQGNPPGSPIFRVTLYADLPGEPARHSASYRLPYPGYSGPFRVVFPAQDDPPGQAFRVEIEIESGSLLVKGRREDSYPYGSLLSDTESAPGDLAFSLSYRFTPQAALQDIYLTLQQPLPILALLIVTLLPGWVCLELLGLNRRVNIWEQVGRAAGLSLAVWAVGMLWTTQLGLRWTETGIQALAVGLGTLSLALAIRRWRSTRNAHLPAEPTDSTGTRAPDWALGGVLLLALLVRLFMVRDLAAPPWVDSVHHALITRLVQEAGGYPASYLPYLDIHPTAYHPGYHSGLAAYQWLSGQALPQAMLAYGQWLNLLAVLAVSLFAYNLTKNRPAAVWAALAAGLLTPMPAYLTSWGRYTHLAGLILLPALVSLLEAAAAAGEKQTRIKLVAVSGLIFAGLVMVHYRVAAFLVFWLLADLISRLGQSADMKNRLRLYSAAGALGMLLCAGWLLPTLQNTILPELAVEVTPVYTRGVGFDASLITGGLGWLALGLAGLGVLLGLWFQPRRVLALGLWVGLLFFLPGLGKLGLPGGQFVNVLAAEINLYLPIGVLAGLGASLAGETASRGLATGLNWLVTQPRLARVFDRDRFTAHSVGAAARIFVTLALAAGGLAAGMLGVQHMLPILNPNTVLARPPDLAAMAWIAANTPPDARFLTNPFRWGYGLCAGNDGGYWIAPLTGRVSYPPPVLYGVGSISARQEVEALCQAAQTWGADPQALHEMMILNDLDYVYIGGRGGPLSPAALSASLLFQVEYAQDGVWVLRAFKK